MTKFEKKKSRGTRTSEFGVSKREAHDASLFYSSKLYESFEVDESHGEIENPISDKVLDKVFCKDSRKMNMVPDSSVHLMVTSPPYNVSKEYDENLTLEEYKELLKDVLSETYRVLVSGGRACINVANVGRKPYIPYHSLVIGVALEIGFLMRGEIIWDKNASAGTSTAWGSYASATNPTLRDIHEYILVFSKEKFSRTRGEKKNTIANEEFLEFTKSIWRFPTESAQKVGHPAPFPIELPYRCIQLYTFENEVVLDPFCGVSSACIAALKSSRHFIGIDRNLGYVTRGKERIEEYRKQAKISSYKTQSDLSSYDAANILNE